MQLKLNSITLALIAASSTSVIAQDETLVVTASGFEQKLTRAPASISVIDQKQLQEKNYNDLGEALSGVEGVDVRGGTGKTGGLDISIRGMPSSYTLILIDGIRQNASADATPNGFGTMDSAMMPPLSAIDHIEVIRGQMSTLYGSDAMGGVINIITKKGGKAWHGSVNLAHSVQQHSKLGDSSQVGMYASGPLVDKKLDLAMRGNFTHRQGSSIHSLSDTGANTRVPYPSETDNYNFGGKLSWHPSSDQTLWLDGNLARQSYDNRDGQLGPVGTRGGGYTDELRYQRQKAILGYDNQLSVGRWNSTLSYAVTENKGRLLTGKSLNPANQDRIGDDRLLRNTNTIFDTKLVAPVGDDHLLQLGGQYWDARMKDGIVLANTGETFQQQSWSLFTEDDWQILQSLSLTWGARYEKHASFGGHFSPRGYLVWDLSDDWTIKGGVSTGYKTPSLSQLHNGISGVTGNGAVSKLGNPNLKPETSVSYETGIYYDNADDLTANITGFINNYRNAIESEALDDNTNSYSNVGKARTQGVEFATSFPLWVPELTLNLNYTFTDSQQRGGDNPGAALTNTARHMGNARLNWAATNKLTTWLAVEYHGKTPRYTNNYNNLSAIQKAVYDARGADLKAWTVVNLGASYQLTKHLKLNGTLNNLLDKDFSAVSLYRVGANSTYAGDYYQTQASTTGYVTPGRNYWLSLNYSF